MASGGSSRERYRYLPQGLPVEDEDPFDEVGRWCTGSALKYQERRKRCRGPDTERNWCDQSNMRRIDCHGNSANVKFSVCNQPFPSGRTGEDANTNKSQEHVVSSHSCSPCVPFTSPSGTNHSVENDASERFAGMTGVLSRGAVHAGRGDDWEALEQEQLVSPVSSTDSFFDTDGCRLSEEETRNDMDKMPMGRLPTYPAEVKKKEEGFLSCSLHGDPRLTSSFGGTCLSFVLQREMVSSPRGRCVTNMPVMHGCSPSPTPGLPPSADLRGDSYVAAHGEPMSTVTNEWISVRYGGAPPYASSSLPSSGFERTSDAPSGAREKSGPIARSDFTVMRVTVRRNPVTLPCASEEMDGQTEKEREKTTGMHRTPHTIPTRPPFFHERSHQERISLQGELTVQCHPLDHCSPSVLVHVTDWGALHPILREANPKLSAHLVSPSRVGHCAVPLPMSSVAASNALFPSLATKNTTPPSVASPLSHWWLLSLVYGGTSTVINERHHRVGASTLRQCRLDGKALAMPALCATLIVEEEDDDENEVPKTAEWDTGPRSIPTPREPLPKNVSRSPTASVPHRFPPPPRLAPSSCGTMEASFSSTSSSSSLHRRLTHHQLYFPLRHPSEGVSGMLPALAFATLTPWPSPFPSPSPLFSFVVLGGTRNGWCPASLEFLSLLHVATDSWTWTTSEVRTTGAIPPARYGHSATLLPSHGAPLERWEEGKWHPHRRHTTDCFDPYLAGGTARGKKNHHPTSTTTPSCVIAVLGGVGKQRQYWSDVHLLQTATGVWRQWTFGPHPLLGHHALSPQHHGSSLSCFPSSSNARRQESGGRACQGEMREVPQTGRQKPFSSSSAECGVYTVAATRQGENTDARSLPSRAASSSSSSLFFSPPEPSCTFPCGGPRGRAFHAAVLLDASAFCHVGRSVGWAVKQKKKRERAPCDIHSASLEGVHAFPKRTSGGSGEEKEEAPPEHGSVHAVCSTSLSLLPSKEERPLGLADRYGGFTGGVPRGRHGTPDFSGYLNTLLNATLGASAIAEPEAVDCSPTRTSSFFSAPTKPSRIPFLFSSFSFLSSSSSSCVAPTPSSVPIVSSPTVVEQRGGTSFLFGRSLSPSCSPAFSIADRSPQPSSFHSSEISVVRRAEEERTIGWEEEGNDSVLLLVGGEEENGLAPSVWSLHLARGEWREWVYPALCVDDERDGGRTREDTTAACVTEDHAESDREGEVQGGDEATATSERHATVLREGKAQGWNGVPASLFGDANVVSSRRSSATFLKEGNPMHGKTHCPSSVSSLSLPAASCWMPSLSASGLRPAGPLRPASRGTHANGRNGDGRRESGRLLPFFFLPRVVNEVESQKLAFALRQEVARTREKMAYHKSACLYRDACLQTHTNSPPHPTLVAPEWSSDSLSNSIFSLTVGSLPQVAVLPPFLWTSTNDEGEEEMGDFSFTSLSPTTIVRASSSKPYNCPTSELWRSCGVLISGGSSSFRSSFLTTCILPMTPSLQGMAEMKLLSAVGEGKLRVL